MSPIENERKNARALVAPLIDEYRAFFSLPEELDKDARDRAEARLMRLIDEHFRNPDASGIRPGLETVISELRNRRIPCGVRVNVLAEMVLASAICERETAAFEAFFEQFDQPIRNLIQSYRGEFGVVALQALDGFALRLVCGDGEKPSKFEKYDGWAGIMAFVKSEARFRLKDALRAKKTETRKLEEYSARQEASGRPDPGSAEPSDEAGDRERLGRMVEALAGPIGDLTPRQRLILVLTEVDGVPQQLIAPGIGVDKSTVSRDRKEAWVKLMTFLAVRFGDADRESVEPFKTALYLALRQAAEKCSQILAIRGPIVLEAVDLLIATTATQLLRVPEKDLILSADLDRIVKSGLGFATGCRDADRDREVFGILAKLKRELDDNDGFRDLFAARAGVYESWTWLAGVVRSALENEGPEPMPDAA